MRLYRRLRCRPRQAEILVSIPGVNVLTVDGDEAILGVTIDAYPVACRRLNRTPKPDQVDEASIELTSGLPLRPYQTDGVKRILADWKRMRYAYLGDDLRLGKTIQAIGAVAELGADARVLVLCPALVLRTWLREIRRWRPAADVLVLDGRGASTARLYAASNSASASILTIRDLKPLVARCLAGNAPIRDRSGAELVYCAECAIARRAAASATCPSCSERLAAALRTALWVICPYDRLTPQTTSDQRGREFQRDDLPGWASTLSEISFDAAIGDEIHRLRSFAGTNENHRRRMANRAAGANVRFKLGLSGTPSFGKFRHLWGQLDWLSDGAYGRDVDTGEPIPFIWERYFCNGRKVAIDGRPGLRVWKADETGPRVATEWTPIRRDRLILARRRVDVAKDLPPLIRDVRRIESTGPIAKPTRRVKNQLDWALAKAFEIKLPSFIDSALDELVTGAKLLVMAKRTAHVDEVATRLQKAIDARGEIAAEARNRNAIVVNARGLVAEKRAALIETFCDHAGAGALITTIDSLADGGISMRGVSSVHHLEYHDSPSAIAQAELRGYEPGIDNGYAITHWHATGTIDDEIEERVIPQVEMISTAFADPTASATASAFRRKASSSAPESKPVDFEAALARYLGE